MKRIMPALAFAALSAAAAAQEDTVRFRDKRKDVVGRLMGAAADFVKVEPTDIPSAQQYPSEDVDEIILDRSNVPSAYSKGDSELNKKNFDAAIKNFAAAAKDAGAPAWFPQFALKRISDVYGEAGQGEAWEKSLLAVKAQVPDTYFLWSIYWDLSDYYIRKKDYKRAEEFIKEFDAAAGKFPNWRGGVRFRQATLAQAQGKYDEALRFYGQLKSDKRVGEDARVWELRCTSLKGDHAGARTRAEALVKGSETSGRVLTAAYNSIGDALLKDGQIKPAMLAYLRGITEYDRAGPNDQHEYALAMSAITMKQYADANSDKVKGAEYAGHAGKLAREFRMRYPDSAMLQRVQDALK